MEKKLSNLRRTADNELFNNSEHEVEIKRQIRNRLHSNRNVSFIKKIPTFFLNFLSYTVFAVLILCIVTIAWNNTGINTFENSNNIKSGEIKETNNAINKPEEKVKVNLLDIKVSQEQVNKSQTSGIPVLKYVFEIHIQNNAWKDKQNLAISTFISAGDKLQPYMKENEMFFNDIPPMLSNLEMVSSDNGQMDNRKNSNEVILKKEFSYMIKDARSIEAALKNAGDVIVTVYDNDKQTKSLIKLGEINVKQKDITFVDNPSNNEDETENQKYKGYKFEIQDLSIKTNVFEDASDGMDVLEYELLLKDVGEQNYEWSIEDDNIMQVGIWGKKSLLKYMVEDSHEHDIYEKNKNNMFVLSSEHQPNYSKTSHKLTFQFKIKEGIDPELALQQAHNSNIVIYIGGQFIQSNRLENNNP